MAHETSANGKESTQWILPGFRHQAAYLQLLHGFFVSLFHAVHLGS